MKLAESFGIAATAVDGFGAEFEDALARGVAGGRASVIVVTAALTPPITTSAPLVPPQGERTTMTTTDATVIEVSLIVAGRRVPGGGAAVDSTDLEHRAGRRPCIAGRCADRGRRGPRRAHGAGGLGAHPGAPARPRDPADRAHRRAEQGGARPACDARDRQALPESLGEVQEVIDTCDFFLGEGRRLYGQTVPSEMPDKQLFTFREPVGVALIVTAGNFLVAVPSWYLVPALLCGNAVVWKPADYTPAIAEAFAQLFLHGGLPDGVLNVVHADGEATFAGLEQALGEGLIDKVGFTGSSAVGRRIGELCGRHLQNPCLELGGKNPMVVMDDADLDLAVEGALFGGFGTAGQRCTSLGTAIVHDAVHDEYLRNRPPRSRARRSTIPCATSSTGR